jgi:hypothetical protein
MGLSISAMFPRASKSFLDANPQSSPTETPTNAVQPVLKRKRGKMTGVEKEFGMMLESQKRNGEILRYEFQGMTLRWGVDERTGDSMRYTPDWVVLEQTNSTMRNGHDFITRIRLIEVKGPYVHYRQQAIARFKGCRSWWPEFSFELWQKQKGVGWVQLF